MSLALPVDTYLCVEPTDMREELRQEVVEGKVVGDDRRDRRGHYLLDIARRESRLQPFLRLPKNSVVDFKASLLPFVNKFPRPALE